MSAPPDPQVDIHRVSLPRHLSANSNPEPANLATDIPEPETALFLDRELELDPIELEGDRPVESEVEKLTFPSILPAVKSARNPYLFWLTGLISVGLHGALMLLPAGESEKPKPSPKPEAQKQVRITQLSPKSKKLPVVKPAAPIPIPKPSIQAPPNRAVQRDRPAPIITKSSPQPTPKPSPKPTPKSSPTPSPTSSPTPSPTSSPTPLPTSSPTPLPTSSPTPGSDIPGTSAWEDFPVYPNAQTGCFELSSCFQANATLTEVSAYFAKEFPLKKYQSTVNAKEATREVYQVSRNGKVQFLSLFATEKGTVYVLSDAPRQLEDLKKAVSVPQVVYDIMSGLDPKAGDPSFFAQPNLFYTAATPPAQRPEIANISLVENVLADEIMETYLRRNLQNNEFDVADYPKQYGGGVIYEIKKGKTILYLNIIPTQDGKSTLVIIWKTPPV